MSTWTQYEDEIKTLIKKEETMNTQLNLDDIELIEDGAETEEEYYEAIQKAINSGYAWKMQGSYGRTMMDAIKSGYCLLGNHRAQDYYGNTIPSRDDVEEGTKGSYEYVVQHQGQEWADLMGNL
jgi:hypothetical protein